MRYERGQKALTIVEADKQLFDKKLNDFLKDVSGDPIIQFHCIDGKFGVTVVGKVERNIPENIADEYELRGEKHYCCECKFCEPKLLPNGRPDRRYKWRNCVHSAKEVCDTSPACEFFYIMLEAKEEIFKGGSYED